MAIAPCTAGSPLHQAAGRTQRLGTETSSLLLATRLLLRLRCRGCLLGCLLGALLGRLLLATRLLLRSRCRCCCCGRCRRSCCFLRCLLLSRHDLFSVSAQCMSRVNTLSSIHTEFVKTIFSRVVINDVDTSRSGALTSDDGVTYRRPSAHSIDTRDREREGRARPRPRAIFVAHSARSPGAEIGLPGRAENPGFCREKTGFFRRRDRSISSPTASSFLLRSPPRQALARVLRQTAGP